MTFHLAAYRESVDAAAANNALNAVVDNAINTEDTFIRVPTALPNLIAEALYVGALTAFTRARIESPSLRQLSNQYLQLVQVRTADVKQDSINWHAAMPRVLQPGEGVEFVVNTDSVAAEEHQGLIWLADGPLQPVQGNVFTTRATAAITAVNTGWVSGVLTFDERLPIADYDVVGMAVEAADGTAARLIFPGLPWRPGTVVNERPATGVMTTGVMDPLRYGRAGTWGRFNLNQPPQLEVFGGAAAAQVVYLDLIRV